MTSTPVPFTESLVIHPGPLLLADLADGPSLDAHRRRLGPLRGHRLPELTRLVESVALLGCGGAAFPFARKLATVADGRRPVVVVNLSEGEPASAKDGALTLSRPHLILDGAVATARALGAKEVHVVLPGERPLAARRMREAMRERDDGVRLRHHRAEPRFVSGQSQAVVELIAGRPNLPSTSWVPAAVSGVGGRPTLLSNAETWARVGMLALRGDKEYREWGTHGEPGTTLLTVTTPEGQPHVHEVEYGARLRDVLPTAATGGAVLVGGFHGSWASWATIDQVRVSVPGMRALGLPLGAGVLHAPGPGRCPLALTSRITDYLAAQSARRCGPCLNGLPELAAAVRLAVSGADTRQRIDELSRLVERRGACAHPDGTVRLVHSLFTALPDEIAAHLRGSCTARDVLEAAS